MSRVIIPGNGDQFNLISDETCDNPSYLPRGFRTRYNILSADIFGVDRVYTLH